MVKQYINKIYLQIYGWFFNTTNLNSLIICRIVFGLCLFFEYFLSYLLIPELFGPHGLPGPDGGRYLFLVPMDWLKYATSMEYVWFAYGLLLVSSLCFTLGYKTKIFGMLTLILHSLFLSRNIGAYAGWAALIKPLMFYVILSPVEKSFSVDAWLKGNYKKNLVGAAWPLRLLQINLCTIYFVAAWSRIDNPSWLSGDAVYGILVNQQFKRFDLDWTSYKVLLRTFSYMGYALELLAPFILWIKFFRNTTVFALMTLHLFLEIFARVNGWSYLMIASLTTFLPIYFYKNK